MQRANLQKLERHRQSVVEEFRHERAQDVQLRPQRHAPTAPQPGSSRNSSKRSSAPPPPPVRHSVLSSASGSPGTIPKSPTATPGPVPESPTASPGPVPPESPSSPYSEGASVYHTPCGPNSRPDSSHFTPNATYTVENGSQMKSVKVLTEEKCKTGASADPRGVLDFREDNKATQNGEVTVLSNEMLSKSEASNKTVPNSSLNSSSNPTTAKTSDTESPYKQCQGAGTANSVHPPLLSLNKHLGRDLVEQMRATTQLSYGKSVEAVHLVLSCLRSQVPEIEHVMDSLLDNLHRKSSDASKTDLTSSDAVRLQEIFSELAKCKDDSQQRSWFLHEDEHIITGHLEELISVLDGAQADVSKAMIRQDHYAAISNLVQYYQMELRVPLRMLLLQVFGSLCSLDAAFISELLNSGLPLELARDMQTDTSDIQLLSYSLLVLTMMFSMGEAVPLHYYTHLNDKLLRFLLDMAEHPPDTESADRILELVVNLVLAYNLHFELPSENAIMQVLAERGTAKFFTERLMFLVNRGEDPVRIFGHEPAPPSSLLKFLTDLYSSPATATVLYTNDARVLIDIIVGQLSDLEPSSQIRTDYLSLMELILKHTDYGEHRHRQRDLALCFRRIQAEEDARAEDKAIVTQIWRDFPHLFES